MKLLLVIMWSMLICGYLLFDLILQSIGIQEFRIIPLLGFMAFSFGAYLDAERVDNAVLTVTQTVRKTIILNF